MSSIVAALLFSAAASAQMTTSLWWLDSASSSVAYQASVVRVSNSMTTMAVSCDYENDEECYYEDAETMVFGKNTYWESTTSYAATESAGDYTMSVACSMTKANSPPLCTASEGGYGAWQEYCSTDDGITYTDDFDYSTSVPDFCSSGTTLPESVAVITTRLPLDYLQYHDVTITAGEEKLGASTGAAASSTGAASTSGSSTFTLAATTGSTASSSGPSATGSSSSSTGSASGTAAPVQTGAAANFAAPIAGMAAVAMAAFAL